MKQNLYQRVVFKRYNMIKYAVLGISFLLASYPRLLIEVFTRRDFGHRYFNFMSCLTIFLVLGWFPLMRFNFDLETLYYVIIEEPLWYGYLFTFLYFAFRRHKELRIKPGQYDNTWFTQSAGVKIDWFKNLKFRGNPLNNRVLDIWIEPLPFFIAGLLLLLFHNILGILLVICAVIYSLSYSAAYALGDSLIYDLIDDNIVKTSTVQFFEGGEETVSKSGVQFYTHRTENKEFGKYIARSLNQQDDDFDEGTSYAF